MKTLLISGSPRMSKSTSVYLLNAIEDKLGENNETILFELSKNVDNKVTKKIVENLSDTDNIVIAYPLYVDCLPSHLLSALKYIEKNIKSRENNMHVYQIVNNGFYDAQQNSIAIDILSQWCRKCRMKKGVALAVGAGEMAQQSPLGHGTSTNLGRAVDVLVQDIMNKNSKDTVYVEPNFPRFLYKMAAHMGWRKLAKANGLKVSDILIRL